MIVSRAPASHDLCGETRPAFGGQPHSFSRRCSAHDDNLATPTDATTSAGLRQTTHAQPSS